MRECRLQSMFYTRRYISSCHCQKLNQVASYPSVYCGTNVVVNSIEWKHVPCFLKFIITVSTIYLLQKHTKSSTNGHHTIVTRRGHGYASVLSTGSQPCMAIDDVIRRRGTNKATKVVRNC